MSRVFIKPQYKRLKKRESLGIACCRIKNNKPEILLIKKRFTYAFHSFCHGLYDSNSDEKLLSLFNNMTVDEKLDILSMSFNQIWYKVWLNDAPNKQVEIASKNKFEKTFTNDEKKRKRLRKLINRSSSIDRIWEIPKGRKNNIDEPNIHCAIREFKEETGINKKQYKIIPRALKRYSFVDSNVRYIMKYYIAIAKHDIKPKVDFNNQKQLDEISNIKWFTIDEIKLLNNKQLTNNIKSILNFVKKNKF